jgi:hypothetical protein
LRSKHQPDATATFTDYGCYNAAMDAEPPRPEPKPKPRRFQFRLRTLMIGITLLAVPLGYIGWQAKIVRERKATFSRLISDPDNFGIGYAIWPRPDNVKNVGRLYNGLLPLDTRSSMIQWGSSERPSPICRWLGEPDICVLAIYISADDHTTDVVRLSQLFPKALIRRLRDRHID